MAARVCEHLGAEHTLVKNPRDSGALRPILLRHLRPGGAGIAKENRDVDRERHQE